MTFLTNVLLDIFHFYSTRDINTFTLFSIIFFNKVNNLSFFKKKDLVSC